MTQLETRPVGDSGLRASIVGLGCNQFGGRLDLDATRAVLDEALSLGVTFLDTANVYGGTRSEEFIGDWMRSDPRRRDQVVLATKFGKDPGDGYTGPRGSAEHVRQAVAASLGRLQTDVIDLYWYHAPDGVTPIGDTLAALHELIRGGTVRAIGASNFTAEEIEAADAIARERDLTRFVAIQNEYSLLRREAEADVLPTCERLGIAFIPFYPLASGLLTGKYRRDQPAPAGARLARREQVATDAEWAAIEALTEYASERGVTLTEVAIGALLARPAVASVIAGATKPEQVRANVVASGWMPSDEDQAALAGLLAAHPV